jgi:predicted ATP-grasp superfamily ATP-dependent carboligase
MQNFLVIGAKAVVIRVLLALHAYTDAKCIVMCPNGTRHLRLSTLCSTYLEIGFTGEHDAAFVEYANRFAQEMPDLVIVPADCPAARMIDRVYPHLTSRVIPAPNAAMLDCLEEKWPFYLFCKKHGLNVPSTRFIGNKHDLDFASTALDLGIPFIVKPVNENSSRGVSVIASEEEYRSKILDNETYQFAPLIAQRYIAGRDVGLDFFSVKGTVKAIAIQRRIDPLNTGSEVEFFDNPYLRDAAHVIAKACSYNGVMNVDARIEDGTGKVYLLESNPRFWDSLWPSVWCGLNFAAECVTYLWQSDEEKALTSGSAEVFYHPLFRPLLWRHAIFDASHRGKMVRLMMRDIYILLSSVGTLWFRYREAVRRRVKAVSI